MGQSKVDIGRGEKGGEGAWGVERAEEEEEEEAFVCVRGRESDWDNTLPTSSSVSHPSL